MLVKLSRFSGANSPFLIRFEIKHSAFTVEPLTMFKYSDLIYLSEDNKQLTFNEGLYHVDIIGGWDIERNNFFVELVNEETGEGILPDYPWPVQGYYGKQSKRLFDFLIPKKGVYRVVFHNPEELIVRKLGWQSIWIIRWFHNNRVLNSLLSIVFYRSQK